VTINGQSFPIAGTYSGDFGFGSNSLGAIAADNYGILGSAQITQFINTFSGVFPTFPDTSFTYTLGLGDVSSGTLLVQNFGRIQNIPIQTNPGFLDAINFSVETVSYSVSAVPELSTWAMILIGFTGVGVMAYRRKKNAALAAA
jgi:hypothetical protein